MATITYLTGDATQPTEGRRLLAEAESFEVKAMVSHPDAVAALASIRAETEKTRREKVVQTGSPQERLAASEEFVQINSMYSLFKSNEVAADAKYKSRELFIEGTVKSVEKEGFGGVMLVFRDRLGNASCQCHLTSEAARSDQLAKVREGSWVRVVGKCKGNVGYSGVQMTGCDFILVNE